MLLNQKTSIAYFCNLETLLGLAQPCRTKSTKQIELDNVKNSAFSKDSLTLQSDPEYLKLLANTSFDLEEAYNYRLWPLTAVFQYQTQLLLHFSVAKQHPFQYFAILLMFSLSYLSTWRLEYSI